MDIRGLLCQVKTEFLLLTFRYLRTQRPDHQVMCTCPSFHEFFQLDLS